MRRIEITHKTRIAATTIVATTTTIGGAIVAITGVIAVTVTNSTSTS